MAGDLAWDFCPSTSRLPEAAVQQTGCISDVAVRCPREAKQRPGRKALHVLVENACAG
jgi:hypothetical protein